MRRALPSLDEERVALVDVKEGEALAFLNLLEEGLSDFAPFVVRLEPAVLGPHVLVRPHAGAVLVHVDIDGIDAIRCHPVRRPDADFVAPLRKGLSADFAARMYSRLLRVLPADSILCLARR